MRNRVEDGEKDGKENDCVEEGDLMLGRAEDNQRNTNGHADEEASSDIRKGIMFSSS